MSKKSQILISIKINRRALLDRLESILKDSGKWKEIRSSIMRTFGKNGLEGMVNEIFGEDE